jgi:hypothetical protein
VLFDYDWLVHTSMIDCLVETGQFIMLRAEWRRTLTNNSIRAFSSGVRARLAVTPFES